MFDPATIALIGMIARIGLEATATFLERLNKPGATIDDAIQACREAQSKTLQDYIAEDLEKRGLKAVPK